MPKPSSSSQQPKQPLDSKSLPDVCELKFDGWEEVTVLLQQLNDFQLRVGKATDEKKGKEGGGLLGEIGAMKSRLSSIMAVAGVPGLRHNNLVFSDCWIEGRETVDIKTLKVELAQAGVDLTTINQCVEKATKKGDGYMRRMLTDLDKPRSGWGDD